MPSYDNNYTLGRGKLYFDQFAPNSKISLGGERYIGDTNTVNMNSTIERLDHYSNDYSNRVKDRSAVVQDDRSGTFNTENISIDNVAMLFGTAAQVVSQTAQTNLVHNIPAAKRDRYFRIGATAAAPQGVRNLTSVAVTKGGTPVAAANNYELDLLNGSIYIFPNATGINDGDALVVTYAVGAASKSTIVDGKSNVWGALRYVSDNAEGAYTEQYFWPYVMLSPDGDYALKGDTWRGIGMNIDVLKLNDATQRVYVDMIPRV